MTRIRFVGLARLPLSPVLPDTPRDCCSIGSPHACPRQAYLASLLLPLRRAGDLRTFSAHPRAPTSSVPDVGVYVRKSAKADLRWGPRATNCDVRPFCFWIPAFAGMSGVCWFAGPNIPAHPRKSGGLERQRTAFVFLLDSHRKSALADLRMYMPTSGTPDVGARE
jgi:hypothetical protein